MLPLAHRVTFLLFALVTGIVGARGFYRLVRRIRAGRHDTDARFDRLPVRIWYALRTTLLQERTFRRRPAIGIFHAFIFYAFVFYLLVNLVDGAEGYIPIAVVSTNPVGAAYNALADALSALAVLGVSALVARRFLLPAQRDFAFNENTLLHEDVQRRYIARDSVIVSAFILFHVGCRAIESGAKLALDGPDRYQPFASLLSYLFSPSSAAEWRVFGYWGALGSVLAFLMYFPYSKHIHLFMAPAKYLAARLPGSGVLPAVEFEEETPQLGAAKLEDLAWPRLLDAYACIQCNRCQDVCPATATGKSLSPASLEINKRMELNRLTADLPAFEGGAASPRTLLSFALTPEAAWACTTCGACMQVCPVQNEQMLDIVDIRRHQVMMEGSFPAQLQSAFRGMERAKNPWGINRDQRMAWCEDLNVKTVDDNPDPDVLYWVGCAASYDPQAQKTARAFVQLLTRAGVNFAVLGKRECCTGDSARRAGNEYLYRQLAEQNVATLQQVNPKLIVATCPHCMNAVGHEYRQLDGNFKVVHHTEYLARLVEEGRLSAQALPASMTYHDPCYLGRHNGVFDAPRNILHVLSNDYVELKRNRENSFCCGAGGAQFWKEEESGTERIAENRLREAQQELAEHRGEKVLAVGCPFCKSMMSSAPGHDENAQIAIKDIAELLLEGVLKSSGEIGVAGPAPAARAAEVVKQTEPAPIAVAAATPCDPQPKLPPNAVQVAPPSGAAVATERKKWSPKRSAEPAVIAAAEPAPLAIHENVVPAQISQNGNAPVEAQPARKKWSPKEAAKKE